MSLPADAVHVWAAPLTAGPERLAALLAQLSDDERQRAARYRHAPSRDQFILTRATLRTLLGDYLGLHPADLRFTTAGNGKPQLIGRELFFNVSHTEGLALFAVTRRGEVGVDVERVCPRSYLDLAERFFAPGEAAALRRLPPADREAAFFHVWTRKEAFLKAVGLGLAYGLERFEVSVPPDDPPRLRHINGDAIEAAAWSLVSLAPAPGYVAALALRGATPEIVFTPTPSTSP